MAFRARTYRDSHGKSGVTDIVAGGPPRTFGTVTVTGTIQTFAGEPPKEMLAADGVDVQDMRGRPYPESCLDRHGMRPRAQALAKMDGKWPDARELKLQSVAERKLADPLGTGALIEMARNPLLKKDEALKLVQKRLIAHADIPELPALATG